MISIDVERRQVSIDDRRVPMAPREFEVLRELYRADGKPLSRETILDKVWGQDLAFEIETNAVNQTIARIRRKLGRHSRMIETVKGAGYAYVGANTNNRINVSKVLQAQLSKTLRNLDEILRRMAA